MIDYDDDDAAKMILRLMIFVEKIIYRKKNKRFVYFWLLSLDILIKYFSVEILIKIFR